MSANDSAQAGGPAGVVSAKSYGVCSLVGALSHGDCRRENSLLYLLLMLGTVWLGLSLYNFTKTYVSKCWFLAPSVLHFLSDSVSFSDAIESQASAEYREKSVDCVSYV